MTDLPEIAPGGRLAENVMYFARVLRQAGLPVGPGHVIDALKALDTAGVRRRDDFYWTLHAVFVSRRDQQELFDQAFHVFWRDPKLLERMLGLMLPTVRPNVPPDSDPLSRRVADALGYGKPRQEGRPEKEELDLDMAMTFTDQEVLREMDFEDMTATEMTEARKAIAAMRLDLKPLVSRRYSGDPHGPRVDMRQTLRRALRSGPGIIPLQCARQRTRPPALVLLCDISGSMAGYSRMLIHFAHALTNDRDRVHTFVFGTRLTNITRDLRQKDVDLAIDKVSGKVSDWQGGTRIGACLHDFNRHWSRRVLGQGAVVVLVTDGLDRDAAGELGHEMQRLRMSCRRLIWLNPLLRFSGFEPRSWGIRTMMPWVDEFRSAHNLKSLADLAEALGRPATDTAREMESWREAGGMSEDLLGLAQYWRESGSGVALATVTATWGSSPRPVGSVLVVKDDGSFRGSVSGGCIEGAVIGEAKAAIGDGKPRRLEFSVSNERAWEVGLTCGGKVAVYVEKLS